MKFTVATKPLIDGLNLAIINSNISQYYRKSCVVQLTANASDLVINVEANGLMSELRFKGKGDSADTVSTLVDCLLFKQLMNTLDSATVTIEFVEGGIKIHSGKSVYSLAQILDTSEFSLARPTDPETASNVAVKDIDKEHWKFVKNNQLYAISKEILHPVYTYVWVSENDDVLVGDVVSGLFVKSNKGDLGLTCLIKDTIVNLLESLPNGAHINTFDDHYVITVATDSFTLLSEFIPVYESDPDVGSYNSDMIFSLMDVDPDNHIMVSTAAILKTLGQIELLNKSPTPMITISFTNNGLTITDSNVNAEISATGELNEPVDISFKAKLLKAAISHHNTENIQMSPVYNGESIVGIVLQTEDLTTVVAGAE